MSKAVRVLKHFEAPKNEGVYHRLICLNGQAKGSAYFLEGKRIILGRGEKADIKVLDAKTSREHAEITVNGQDYVVTDLGSQNGILINDQKVSQHKLKDGDKLTIGQVIFKFSKVEVRPKFNESPKQEEKKGGSAILMIVIVAAVGLFFMSDEEESVTTKKKKSTLDYNFKEVSDDFEKESKRKKDENQRLKKQLNVIFQRGQRELREGNFYRAMSEFDHALSMNPSDKLAEFYLNKTREALDDAIEQQFIKANRDLDALKYQSASVAYCAITRLLYFNKEDERYKNALEGITKVEEKLGLEKGEINCTQK
jgi:pSer/pThr/pTyr-binding forkhead associated (FHA) protein